MYVWNRAGAAAGTLPFWNVFNVLYIVYTADEFFDNGNRGGRRGRILGTAGSRGSGPCCFFFIFFYFYFLTCS